MKPLELGPDLEEFFSSSLEDFVVLRDAPPLPTKLVLTGREPRRFTGFRLTPWLPTRPRGLRGSPSGRFGVFWSIAGLRPSSWVRVLFGDHSLPTNHWFVYTDTPVEDTGDAREFSSRSLCPPFGGDLERMVEADLEMVASGFFGRGLRYDGSVEVLFPDLVPDRSLGSMRRLKKELSVSPGGVHVR